MVGSGGGGGVLEIELGLLHCEDIEPGEASFLCVRRRLVRACWMSETRAKGVWWGRWRWASLILEVGGWYSEWRLKFLGA